MVSEIKNHQQIIIDLSSHLLKLQNEILNTVSCDEIKEIKSQLQSQLQTMESQLQNERQIMENERQIIQNKIADTQLQLHSQLQTTHSQLQQTTTEQITTVIPSYIIKPMNRINFNDLLHKSSFK